MGIKRGDWQPSTFNKTATVKTGRHGARPAPMPANAESHSSDFLANRAGRAQEVSIPTTVSDARQELIRGTEGPKNLSKFATPQIVYSPSFKYAQEINKTASVGSSSFSSLSPGGANTVRQAPEVYSPLFQIANLQLPRDRITMNAWNRNFYDTHPLVHNCINLHATYPIGKINIKCKDQKVQQFFSDMADEIDLPGILQAIALEFWKIGEAFPYAMLDENRGLWKHIDILNPDYVSIQRSIMAGGADIISLKPDPKLLKLVQSNNPNDIQLRSQLDPEIVNYVRRGSSIPLDNFNVSHLKMLSSPSDSHGTSVIVSIYKDLMLYDKLRESKFAQADNLVNPITVISVGGNGEGEYHPTDGDLEKWRQTFESAQYDKDFKIISHAGVKIERVGASGAIIDISNDMNFILDNILYGLMVPKSVLTQEGASFNSASIGLEVLKQRYESFRNMMSQWLIKKIFAPISEIHEFYEYKDGVKKLIIPEVDWNQMILFDMDNYINVVQGLVQNGLVSQSTLFRSLGLSVEEERHKIKEEMIQKAIAQKEQQLMMRMSLGALRALKPEEDIIEPTEAPLPGVPGSEESGMPGSGMPGMDMGLGGPPGGLGGGLGGPPGGGMGLGGPPIGGPELGGLGGPPGGELGLGGPPGGGLGGPPAPGAPPAPGGGAPPPATPPAAPPAG